MEERSSSRASLSEGTPSGEPGVRVYLMRTPKYILSKALEWASVCIGALLLGNMERIYFLRALEIKR